VNLALAGVAWVTVAGAVLAVSARDARAAVLGLLVVFLAIPLLVTPVPGPLVLAARLASALLAGRLLLIAVRGIDVPTEGSRIGWPAEILAAAAAAVIGFGSHGLGAAALGPAEAQAAGFALGTLAAAPLVRGRDVLRLGIGAALLVVALPRLVRVERIGRFRLVRWLRVRCACPREATKAWLLVSASWSLRALALYVLLAALGVSSSFPLALFFLCATAASTALPIAPAGAATQAGAGAAILVVAGVKTSHAVAFAISAQALVIVAGAAVVVADTIVKDAWSVVIAVVALALLLQPWGKISEPLLVALAAAVGLVLLIAVANVVNLQLARAVRRQDEFSIRVALGAGRSRLLAQLVTEGLLLATLGGLAGLAVARFSLPLLVAKLPPSLPRLSAIHVSPMALAAVSGIVLLLALVMGLVPARSPADDLGIGLRSGRRLLGGRNHSLRVGLVVGEIALAMLLLVSAGLVSRSLIRLLSVDAGFEPRNLLSLEINSVGNRYATNESVWAYHDRVREAVGALPGVVDVAVANQLPLAGNVDMYGVIDPDNIPANPELVPSGDRYVVSESYFKTMHIPLLRGRLFTNAESPDTSQWVAIVSQGLADKLWPGVDPIGKRIRLGGMKGKDRRIIGLVGDVKHRGLDATTGLQWYAPERQWFADNQEMLIVRTSVDPSSIAGAVRKAISEIDPTQPVVKIATMDQLIATSTAQRRLALVLFAAFAIAALLLAVAGVYGVLAGSVAERTREIGVRSALGATPRNIVGLVVGQGGRLAAIGIAIGLAGSLAVTRYLSSLLFNIQPTDPATLGGVAALLAVVTVAACLIPATRAARVDPSRALRSE